MFLMYVFGTKNINYCYFAPLIHFSRVQPYKRINKPRGEIFISFIIEPLLFRSNLTGGSRGSILSKVGRFSIQSPLGGLNTPLSRSGGHNTLNPPDIRIIPEDILNPCQVGTIQLSNRTETETTY